MKRISVYLILFFTTTFLLSSLEWPCDNKNFSRLFAERISDKTGSFFEFGVVFSNEETVRASDYGKCLITISKDVHNMNDFPSTLGNCVILTHSDDIQTVYANLSNISVFDNRKETDVGSTIGKTGSSAWGQKNSLIFQVLDIKNKVYINPSLLLPNTLDKFYPTINKVMLVNDSGVEFNLKETTLLKQGSYSIYVNAKDAIFNENEKFNPIHFYGSLNGNGYDSLSFQTITVKNGIPYIKNNITADSLYGKDNMLFLGNIKLVTGVTNFEIAVKDLNGNEKIERFTFNVN